MTLRNIAGRVFVLAMATSMAVQPIAAMQFGGLLGGGRSSSSNDDAENPCETREPSIGRSILGRALGRATREVTGGMGVAGSFIPSADVANELTNTIACRLDPDEQQKAADATLEATRGEAVGSTASWTSETRPGVTGTSTVAAREERAGGTTCMTVTDVIIVNGEETTEDKLMCRGPGEARYTLVA